MELLIPSQLLYGLILELIINFIPKFVIKCEEVWLVIHGGFNVNPYKQIKQKQTKTGVKVANQSILDVYSCLFAWTDNIRK